MIEGHQVLADRGAVAAQQPAAARIGAHILAQGGNAMDAATATSLACCMLAPQSNGIGGYMSAAVVLEGSTGRVWSLDANAVAPAAAHEHMYDILPARRDNMDTNEKEYACSVRDDANVYGPQSIAVPGQMAGMGFLHERWGQVALGYDCRPGPRAARRRLPLRPGPSRCHPQPRSHPPPLPRNV